MTPKRFDQVTDDMLGELVASNPQASVSYIQELRKSLVSATKKARHGNSLADCMAKIVNCYDAARSVGMIYELDEYTINQIRKLL